MTDLLARNGRAIFTSGGSGGSGWSMEEGLKAGYEMVPTTIEGQTILNQFKAGKTQTTSNLSDVGSQVMSDIFSQTAMTLQRSLNDAVKSMNLTDEGEAPVVEGTCPDSMPVTGLFDELVSAVDQLTNKMDQTLQAADRLSKVAFAEPKRKKKRKLRDGGIEIDDYKNINSDPQDGVVLEQRDYSGVFAPQTPIEELFWAYRKNAQSFR